MALSRVPASMSRAALAGSGAVQNFGEWARCQSTWSNRRKNGPFFLSEVGLHHLWFWWRAVWCSTCQKSLVGSHGSSPKVKMQFKESYWILNVKSARMRENYVQLFAIMWLKTNLRCKLLHLRRQCAVRCPHLREVTRSLKNEHHQQSLKPW